MAQKKLPEALASFTDAAKNAEAAGDRPLTVRARINAGRAALALNQPEAARDWLDKALDGLKDFPPSHEKATSLIQIGLGYHQLRTGMPTNGTALLLRAAGSFVEAGDVDRQDWGRPYQVLCERLSRAISTKPSIAMMKGCN